MPTDTRYKVVIGSESGHCCFDATVVDTHTTKWHDTGEWVCECFTEEDAHKICAALNAAEPPKP